MIIPIKNYEDLYGISDQGKVFAFGAGESNNSQKKELKAFKIGTDKKYLAVRLYKNGIFKDYRVHRLVAEAFLGESEFPQVNHKDENTFNNSQDNLEWCTAQYNKEYSSSVNIELISPEGIHTRIFNISKFCRENQLSNGCIYHLLSGRYSQHKGWRLLS